jgi:hypothetical protein
MAGITMQENMACMFYAQWYKEDVSPKLTPEQKEKLLKKLSELSLRMPIWEIDKVPLDDFPELKPFSNLPTFSGLQLYTVMSEVFNEISATKLETPYMHFPEKYKSIKGRGHG